MNLPDKTTGSVYTAAEWTEFKNEVQNLILSTGLSLASSSTQARESVKRYAIAGDFYIDSGSADNYVLSKVGSYGITSAYILGMRCRFVANATNTGASTVNVSGLGAITIKKDQWTNDLSAGDIVAGQLYELVYDTTSGFFEYIDVLGGGITFPITEVQGGTNQTTYAQGDTIYASAVDTISKLTKGTALQLYRMNAGATVPEWADTSDIFLRAYIKDVKPPLTRSGTFSNGAWRTRTLNTLTGDTSFISILANQIILDSGTYIIYSTAPAHRVEGHITRLYNITDVSETLLGGSSFTNSSDACTTHSFMSGLFTIAAQKTFELQHQCQITYAVDGFGQEHFITTVNNIYAQVMIIKIA